MHPVNSSFPLTRLWSKYSAAKYVFYETSDRYFFAKTSANEKAIATRPLIVVIPPAFDGNYPTSFWIKADNFSHASSLYLAEPQSFSIYSLQNALSGGIRFAHLQAMDTRKNSKRGSTRYVL